MGRTLNEMSFDQLSSINDCNQASGNTLKKFLLGISHQIEMLQRVSSKVYPNCEISETYFCQLQSRI